MLKNATENGVVKCGTCNGDHWTLMCPYKLLPEENKPVAAVSTAQNNQKSTTKYVPPILREGANKGGSTMGKGSDDTVAIRVSNLSESTQDGDLEDLVKQFGPISKLYLAKDKQTNYCKGFAYVHFKSRADAAKAIANLNGLAYDGLILSVDWSKQQQNQTISVQDLLHELKNAGKGMVKCRTCNGDHSTLKCSYKDMEFARDKLFLEEEKLLAAASPAQGDKESAAKNMPPIMQEEAIKEGSTIGKSNDDTVAIRVLNLSESTQNGDLEDLVKPFGPISKLYLAKDKKTGCCRGKAFIHFKSRADAAKAIANLDGCTYNHLILSVDWSIQQQQRDQKKPEEDPLHKLKNTGKGVVKCLLCKGDHSMLKCKLDESATMREGVNKGGKTMGKGIRDDASAIRVSNLSESTQDGFEEYVHFKYYRGMKYPARVHSHHSFDA